jgi:hypothetical protein
MKTTASDIGPIRATLIKVNRTRWIDVMFV